MVRINAYFLCDITEVQLEIAPFSSQGTEGPCYQEEHDHSCDLWRACWSWSFAYGCGTSFISLLDEIQGLAGVFGATQIYWSSTGVDASPVQAGGEGVFWCFRLPCGRRSVVDRFLLDTCIPLGRERKLCKCETLLFLWKHFYFKALFFFFGRFLASGKASGWAARNIPICKSWLECWNLHKINSAYLASWVFTDEFCLL